MTAEQTPGDHRWRSDWADELPGVRIMLEDVSRHVRKHPKCVAVENCIWPVACALVATAGASTTVGDAFDAGCEFICSQARKAADLAADDLGDGGVAQ